MSLDGGETDYSVTVKLKAFRLLEARVAGIEERLGKRLEALEERFKGIRDDMTVLETPRDADVIDAAIALTDFWREVGVSHRRPLADQDGPGARLERAVDRYREVNQ